jgi:hypothetical protein
VWPDASPPCNDTLQACIDAAQAGDVVEIHTNGPILESVTFSEALTLRAGSGFVPVFSGNRTISASTAASAADQTITIQGLTLESGNIHVVHAGTGTATIEILDDTIGSAEQTGILISGGPGSGPISFQILRDTLTVPDTTLGIEVDATSSPTASGAVSDNSLTMVGHVPPPAIALANQDGSLTVDAIANRIGSVSAAEFQGGIEFLQGGPGAGTLIARALDNLVTEGADFGIVGSAGGGNLSIKIVNNTLAGGADGIRIVGSQAATTFGAVANNVIAGFSGIGLTIDSFPGGAIADRNNLYFGNQTNTDDPSITLLDSVFADPRYAASDDYHLQPGSPAIDAGDDGSVPADLTTDFDGHPRIQGGRVDIGAYETAPEPGRELAAVVALAALCALGRAGRPRRRTAALRRSALLAAVCVASLCAATAQALVPCPTCCIVCRLPVTHTWPTDPEPCNDPSNLQACIDAAQAGDVVEIHTNGPILESVTFSEALTLRAGSGFVPVFSGNQTISASTAASSADQTIAIQGLTLQSGSIHVVHAGTGTATIEILDDTIGSASDGGIMISGGSGSGPISFQILRDTLTLPDSSLGIVVDATSSPTASGAVSGNVFTMVGTAPLAAISVQNMDGTLSLDAIANRIESVSADFEAGIQILEDGAGTLVARVLDNLVEHQGGPDEAAIQAGSGTGGALSIEIVNNTVAGGQNGIKVFSAPNAHVVGTVANNVIAGFGGTGLTITSTPGGAVADRNNLYFGNQTNTDDPSITLLDSVFADPLYEGGDDYHLKLGSPAIDAGDDGSVPADLATDLDGHPRIQGGHVDIGAYETAPELDARALAVAVIAALLGVVAAKGAGDSAPRGAAHCARASRGAMAA